MTHLESLTAKLHALLPELRKRSFGCLVIPKGKTNPRKMIGTPRKVRGECYTTSLNEEESFERTPIEGMNILGHEIQIHHVMKALSRAGFIYMVRPINATSCWIQAKDNAEPWDLDLPLHKQSPELHKSLDNLLPEPNKA